MRSDKQRIVEIASSDLDAFFQREAERMVKKHRCEEHPCETLCRRARQDIRWVINFLWQEYSKLN